MKPRVGNKVTFTGEFYNDPYQFVPALELYDDLCEMGVQGGGSEFSQALKDVTATIVSMQRLPSEGNQTENHITVEYDLFGQTRQAIVFEFEISLTPESIEANKRQDELNRLKKQEEAGQLRLWGDE